MISCCFRMPLYVYSTFIYSLATDNIFFYYFPNMSLYMSHRVHVLQFLELNS